MINVTFDNFYTFLLVFARIASMILFTPVFSRQNIPMSFRMSLIFFLSFIISSVIQPMVMDISSLTFIFYVMKEVILGFAIGFIFQAFYYMLFFVGDMVDLQIGLAFSKIFDPTSNVQMSISGIIFTFLFMIYVFATDGHLELIKIFSYSFQIIPIGSFVISPDFGKYMVEVFISVFMLSLRLYLPFVVALMAVEVSMGILMKIIPQIQVFVINIQFKLLIGLSLMFLFAVPIAGFLDYYFIEYIRNIQDVLAVFIR